MKIYGLRSKLITVTLTAVMSVSTLFSPTVFADELSFDGKEGFKLENVARDKSVVEADGWLSDISDNLSGDIIAYEYINQSSVENNTGNLLIDGDMETFAEFSSLRDLQITHGYSGTIAGVEIFYAPGSGSVGKSLKVTGSKLTQVLNTFEVEGEEGELTSTFVPVNYETNGGKLRIYSGGTYGYALDVYEIKIYTSSGDNSDFEKITDGDTDVSKSFISLNADGKAIIDLGQKYDIAGIRMFSAENLKFYLSSEYPDGVLNENDLVYTAASTAEKNVSVACGGSARYLCIAAAGVSAKCAEAEVYAYLPIGGEIAPSDLVNLSASYPSENDFAGVTNNDGHENIVVAFNEEVITSYLNGESVVLLDNNDRAVTCEDMKLISDSISIPILNLASNTGYKLVIKKGVVTKSGKVLNDDFVLNFSTAKLKTAVTFSEIIKSVSPSNGSGSVTNLGAYGFVKIGFSIDMLPSSFAEAVVIQNEKGQSIDKSNYISAADSFKLDLSKLDSNTKYTLTVNSGKLSAADCNIIGDDFSMTFTTGEIFPYESIEGYRIMNVALNKQVYSNSKNTQTPATNINDGDYNKYFILSNSKSKTVIDLGGYYKVITVQYVAASAFDYNTSTQNHYHTKDTSIYSSCEYPNDGFSNATLLHTTKEHMNGEKTMIKNIGDEYVRYISYTSPYGTSVCAEIEAYAYVKEDYMPITYDITQSGCVVSTSVKNYSDSDKDVYMLISAYDENGDYVGLKCKKFVAGANTTTPIEARYSLLDIRDSLLSANVKRVVIQLLSGFYECMSLSAPLEIIP